MSRWSNDARADARDAGEQTPARTGSEHISRLDDAPSHSLTLPRGVERERIDCRGREFSLSESETRVLATVGAFRVVTPGEVGDGRHGRSALHGDWRRLTEQGLLTRGTITGPSSSREVVALTRQGKALLDTLARGRSGEPAQEYYAGIVKPRELAHDADVYRAYRTEAARIEAEGGRVTRIVLDYELKRDYQTFLNREGHEGLDVNRRAFAEAHDLPVIDGHLALPDLRIEYETADGRSGHRDVEVVTEHYSRGQLGGKARAGFACYRAGGSGSRTGGTPFDPRQLERLG